jgi:folate-dependent tRNA-U54 methylase TrmFO/GidA
MVEKDNRERTTKLHEIYRLLTPEHQVELYDLVCTASFAENSARKSLGLDSTTDNNYLDENFSDYLEVAEQHKVPEGNPGF